MHELVIWIRGAQVYDPLPRGRLDLLLGGGRILAMAPRLEPGRGLEVQEIQAAGRLVVPGYVDSLVHVSGGGGEGGFATRTPALAPAQALEAGVTSLVGALGTDDVTRSHADLLASCRALGEHGLSAYALTGSYRVPVRTLTGSVRDDLVLVPDFIGVGEIAIADHRGSQPNAEELARIAADARVGGLLSGKRGTVLVHVGDGEEGLALLHECSDRHHVPVAQWHPTHINRRPGLLAQGPAWAARGGTLDLTTSTSDALLEAGEVPAARALRELLAEGVPPGSLSLSSDGQASLPHFDAEGRLLGLEVADMRSLHATVREAVQREGLALELVLPAVTSTPAAIWGLRRKGVLQPGADADLLLLDEQDLGLAGVIAAGALRRGG